jgi:hypothetical protein
MASVRTPFFTEITNKKNVLGPKKKKEKKVNYMLKSKTLLQEKVPKGTKKTCYKVESVTINFKTFQKHLEAFKTEPI